MSFIFKALAITVLTLLFTMILGNLDETQARNLCFQCPFVTVSYPRASKLAAAHCSDDTISQRPDCPDNFV